MWTTQYHKHLRTPPVDGIGVSYPPPSPPNSLLEKALTAQADRPLRAPAHAIAAGAKWYHQGEIALA